MYKVYAEVLADKLREEVEKKRLVPENQAGFRRGRGTMDNIYAMNYVVNRNISKKGGKLVAFFVNLKAAFDMMDREILVENMRKRGIREEIVDRCKDVMRETKSRVRARGKLGKGFWTRKGVRQGCPLSPDLFNILMADLEEELKKGGWEGVKLKGEKIYSLAYADDIVLLAEEKERMRCMVRTMEEYLRKKGMELNVGKSKIVRFKKGGDRQKVMEWWWREEKIKEVKEFKYLGFTFQKNGEMKAHLKDRVKKEAAVMGQVWVIGKRKFGKEWGKRMWLFDVLVWSVIGYGAEIWGWKE